jgi:hypothetical protein
MKKHILILALALFGASALNAATPALTPAQVVELQYTGERAYGKAVQEKRAPWVAYNEWRQENEATVFASGLPQIAEIAAINPGIAGLIIRNYVGATTNPATIDALKIAPIAGYDPVALSKEYAHGTWVGWFATAQEVTVLEGKASYLGSVRAAAKRLGDTGLVTAYYPKIMGQGVMDNGYRKWLTDKVNALAAAKNFSEAAVIARIETFSIAPVKPSATKEEWLKTLRAWVLLAD